MHCSQKLVIISPVRNEAEHLTRTVNSTVAQTLRPIEWIIVDDGSTDGTTQIAEDAARHYDWIRVLRRGDRGFRKNGLGVMEAFYSGFNTLQNKTWDFLAKLDGDIEFPSEAFARIIDQFTRDPGLGICGGEIYHEDDGRMVIESKGDPAFHVRGATKFYRRQCWNEIGGLIPVTGWDTLDEVKAKMLGWNTYRTADARFLHLRPTGGADGGWRNAFKNGRGSYISGFHPVYVISKSVKRLCSRPYVIQSLGLLAGFFSSYFAGVQQIQDRALVRYLRSQQMRRLLGQPSIWR